MIEEKYINNVKFNDRVILDKHDSELEEQIYGGNREEIVDNCIACGKQFIFKYKHVSGFDVFKCKQCNYINYIKDCCIIS